MQGHRDQKEHRFYHRNRISEVEREVNTPDEAEVIMTLYVAVVIVW
jgi:hypothetical protein